MWDSVQKQVQESPGLEAKTLFEWLQREYPGRFSDGQIRTLQRRDQTVAGDGGTRAQEVYFGQRHTPGRLCASDFTQHEKSSASLLLGRPLNTWFTVLRVDVFKLGNGHNPALFRESGKRSARAGKNAVWELGAVAAEHRTDSLSSAVNNMSNLTMDEFNQRYERVMRYYGVKPQHTNPASPHMRTEMLSKAIIG